MSSKESVELPSRVLVDADVFFSYLVEDKLSSHSEKLIDKANQGLVKFACASELYDDIITALRSDNVAIEVVIEIITDQGNCRMKSCRQRWTLRKRPCAYIRAMGVHASYITSIHFTSQRRNNTTSRWLQATDTCCATQTS